MRISKRVLSIVLSLLMALTMMPFTAFAADEPYADLKNTTTVITFDEKQWYMLDYDDSTVTLLSKECVGKSVFGTNNTYSGSTLETYVNNWYSENITADDKTAVADNKAFILESLNGINPDVLKCNQVEGTIYNLWWLCSQDHSENRAMCVDGQVGYLDSLPVAWESGVRPALKLDLSKVEFNSETKTFALPTPAVPQATVTEVEAPEGAAFAYKFTAPAGTTAYDSYKADFVATFDRDIKAGEVTLYGKYGSYDWTPVVINRDIAAGEEFLIVSEFLNDTLSYATIRDEVSPFYCGAGGAVLADTNMTVQLKLFNGAPTVGGGIAASEVVTDDIAEPLPQAIVESVTGAPEGVTAYSFTAPHSASEVDSSAYKDYRCDFVVTFDKDIAAGDVSLWGNYGTYGWVEAPAMAFTANTEYRLLKDLYGDTLTYATICKEVSPFLCGFSGAAAEATGMKVELRFYKVEGETETFAGVAGEVDTTVPAETNTVPVASVESTAAPEGAAFAYKFTAPAGTTEYDSYKADFVATFDRDIKAGEVTLYGKYGSYDWTPVVIDRDVAAGEEFLIVSEFLNDTLSYATIRDEVSPFYCGAGGAVLADTNMTVQLKLFNGAPTVGGGIAASEVVTDDIAEPLPQAIVESITGAPEGVTAYSFTAPHSAAEVDSSAYKDYRCDFVVTFDKDIAAGDVSLWGNYGTYGWVEAPAMAFTANTEYRLLKDIYGDTLTYATICKEVSPFLCGFSGATAEATGMKVELRFYKVEGETETFAGVAGEVDTTVPAAEVVPDFEDKYSILIKDEIDLKIYVDDDLATHLGVQYNTLPDKEDNNTPDEPVKKAVSEFTHKNGFYEVLIPLAPAQIRDEITIVVYKNDTVLRTITTSVAQYCESIKDSYTGDNAELVKKLAKATLDYGKAASTYFNYNTTAFAGQENNLPFISDDVFGNYENNSSNLAISTVSYVATSIPELRFTVTQGLEEEEYVELNSSITSSIGTAKFVKNRSGEVILQVKGIPASKLGEQIVITAGTYTVKYTPIKWAIAAVNESDASLAGLAKAIANYASAAAAYAAAAPDYD